MYLEEKADLYIDQVSLCCSVLQCGVVGHGGLQYAAVCCSLRDTLDVCGGEGRLIHRSGLVVVQWIAMWCNGLQYVAVCCSVLQYVAVYKTHLMYVEEKVERYIGQVMLWCSVLQRGAMGCSGLQCVTVCCSMLQCVAVCCSLQDALDVHGGEGRPIHESGCIALQWVAVCCSMLRTMLLYVAILYFSCHAHVFLNP